MSIDTDDPRVGYFAAQLARLSDIELDTLMDASNDVDRRLIEQVRGHQQGLGWRATPTTMMAHFNPTWSVFPYQQLLGEKFRQLVTGENRFQIWNVPARYGKSTIASQYGPAWVLDRTPGAKMILSSYGDSLVRENADIVRTILESHTDELGVRLRKDRRGRNRFATPEGGGVLAASIMAAVTGFGAGHGGGIVLDDVFKNWQEAHSETTREAVWNAYRSVFRLRLDDESAFILIVMTRWHEDDLVGRLLAAADADGELEQWDVTRLAARAEVADPNAEDPVLRLDDPLGRAPGETLGRFSDTEVDSRAREIGSYLAAAMEQQRPAPEEGGELKRAWWQWTDSVIDSADDWASSWDMKLKDTETGDYVVGQVVGRTGGDYWFIDQFRGKWDQATTRAAIALCHVRHPQVRRHFIENTGYGPEVIKFLRNGAPKYEVSDDIAGELGMTVDERAAVQRVIRKGLSGLVAITVKGSKSVRARAVSPILEAGNVHLLSNAGWATQLVNEAASFPNGTHDDMVDAWSQALGKMSVTRARASTTKKKTGAAGGGPGPGRPQPQKVRNVPDPTKVTPTAKKKPARAKARVGVPSGGVRRRPPLR